MADEARKRAKRSMAATRQAKTASQDIQQEARKIVENVNRAVSGVNGARAGQACGALKKSVGRAHLTTAPVLPGTAEQALVKPGPSGRVHAGDRPVQQGQPGRAPS